MKDFGDGVLAYFQPNGSWGLANSGLVHNSAGALLVDTLFDRPRTAAMLQAFGKYADVERIGTVVNTHANGDHWWGNALLPDAEIIATERAAAEMAGLPPASLAAFLDRLPSDSPTERYLRAIFGNFEFAGNAPRLPTRTFAGTLSLRLGDEPIELLEVGPAHTGGDLMVHLPERKALFSGDILFIDSHPIVWAGPLGNWIAACERIIELDPEVVVPGHGPIADLTAVGRVREYLAFINVQARARYESGMSVREAARDIVFEEFRHWRDAERVVANVDAVYREIEGRTGPPDYAQLTAEMAELAAEWGLHGLLPPAPICAAPHRASF
ncbi:MBL fold metallo-hydrolase (plasmid) [Sinorhizobium meliloti]|uniref:MBL fold metallo-hydrolase n=1 Tax=Rhizobium meliloti TaxID=382 RepID=UPI0019123694|nr:MBL fold metallo-hydrolase [Sinorhizobium meliloti]